MKQHFPCKRGASFESSSPQGRMGFKMEGSRAFCLLKTADDDQRVMGWVVEAGAEDAVLAITESLAQRCSGAIRGGIGFVRVPNQALRSDRPPSRDRTIENQLPDLRKGRGTWFAGEALQVELSEAEMIPSLPAPPARPKAAQFQSSRTADIMEGLVSWKGLMSAGSESSHGRGRRASSSPTARGSLENRQK